MRIVISMFGAAALLASCAHTGTPAETTDQFSFNSDSGAYTVVVTPSSLSGPEYQISRFPGGLRGTIANQSLDVQTKGDKITGVLGSRPINLTVTNEGKVTRIKGLYAGVLSNLEVGPAGIQGNAGRCSYSLNGAADQYTGFSVCDGGVQQPTSIHLPSGLAPSPGPEQAAALAILLGR